jgi:hypothetical protein
LKKRSYEDGRLRSCESSELLNFSSSFGFKWDKYTRRRIVCQEEKKKERDFLGKPGTICNRASGK